MTSTPKNPLEQFKAYSLPVKLLPVDAIAIILLIDLNIKSRAGVTLTDLNMKLEAIAFTVVFAIVLLATVLQAIVVSGKKKRRG
jgi:hypothetical protein